nr:MAG TPA: Repressor protein CI [Bacteriophage sp.]
MPKRVFDRSTSYESRVIDMHTGKPVPAETKPMICDRIRHYREKLGMEQKALATMVGVTANAVSNWERGRARPDVNLLPDICEALQITLYQLYGLDDPSVKYTAVEDIIENYRQLTPGHQYALRAMAQNLLQVQQAEGCREIHKLTRFEHQLAAGIGNPNEFEDSGTPIYVYDDSLTCRADCVFTVNGDSMEPDYPDGCMVLVKRISDSGELTPGDIGAFMIDNETYIKEYREDGLHSLNPAYPVMRFSDFEHVYLIGRIIGVFSPESIATEADVKKYLQLHGNAEN